MSLKKNSHFVVVGGMIYENYGRALGPYRVRTAAENAGFVTSIIDYPWVLSQHDMDRLLDHVVGPNTLAIGISYTWEVASPMQKLNDQPPPIMLVRNYLNRRGLNVKIILGCATDSRIPPYIRTESDWIISGFAELSLPAVLQYLAGKNNDLKFESGTVGNRAVNFVNSNTNFVVSDMTQLETVFEPADNFQSHQPLTIETCRGCVFSCAYCNYQFKGKKDYQYIRPVENLAEEFRRNYHMFGTTRYMIADDTFNDSMEKIDRLRRAVDMAKLPDFEFVCYLRPELLVLRPEMIPALIDLGLRGAHFGLESYNDQSRRLVGRSSEMVRVIDAIRELKSQSPRRIGTLATFIVGLPHDTKDQLERDNQHLMSTDNDYLDAWLFGGLMLRNKFAGNTISFNPQPGLNRDASAMEMWPEKYGYKVHKLANDKLAAAWHNEHMNSFEADKMAERFNQQGAPFKSFGGWYVASGWYFGLGEDYMAQPGNLKMSTLYELGRQSCVDRSQQWLAQIAQDQTP
jgi:radical SAM superfamily enzyme YgiQ (UPF0313 family)